MDIKKFFKELLSELAIMGIIPLLFVINLLLFNWKNTVLNTNNYIIFLGILLFAASVEVVYIFTHISGINMKNLTSFVEKHKVMLIGLLIICVVRLPYLNNLPRWDAGEYYYRLTQGLKNCTFDSFTDFQKNFALCGHPTLIFSIIYLIGELMFPGEVIGVNLVSLVLTLIAFWCVYKILLKILRKTTYVNCAIFTVILSFAPLVYSSFSYFTPDYSMALFIIYVIYACTYNRPLIAGFFSMACFQTKETGMVLIGGYVLGILIHYKYKFGYKGSGKNYIGEILKDMRLYFIFVAALIQFLYNKFIGGVSQWTQNANETAGLRWDNNGSNCLGFNIYYILVKLKQQFLLNFNWIVVLIIIGGFIYFHMKNGRKIHLNLKYIEIVTAFICYVAFSCIYITASLARYNVAGDILLYILMFGVLNRIIDNSKQVYVSAIVGFLALLQCFLTIDPITRISFLKLNLGNTSIMYVGNTKNEMIYGDYLVYNTQYIMINNSIDKALKKSGYNPIEYDVVVADLNGACVTGNSAVFLYNWDMKKHKRCFYENDNTVDMPDMVQVNSLDDCELKDNAVLVYLPYNQNVTKEEMLSKASEYYIIGEEKQIWSVQGSIYYYEMTLR